MKTQDEYLDIIHEGLQRLQLPATPAGLYQPITYTLDGGGKRLRPVLALATADALGADPTKVLWQALALEVFHNFTLLHDDVMDRADVRRGRPTVHVRWNENTAILSGDAMLTLASQLLLRGDATPERLLDAAKLFNTTAMEVYEGQQMDMNFESRTDVTVDEYIEMIRLKTSVLLACACAMGALMAGAEPSVQRAFYAYGVNLGLAFQLRDDYLDTFGDPAIFGKQIGGDILNDKKTWLLIRALEHYGERLLSATDKTDEEKVARIRNAYVEAGLDLACQQEIEKYINLAINALPDDITPAARSFFTDLARRSGTRAN